MSGSIFFGSPEFAVPSLEYLVEAGEDVRLVVTQPDKPRGRTRTPVPTPVKESALKLGIKVISPRAIRTEAFAAELEGHRPEFLVVVAYGRILPNRVLDIPSIAPVNLHASLLPKYRGSAPMNWAIRRGERETGLTTMIITENLDEGDILLAERFPIEDDDTTATLARRLSVHGGPLLKKTLDGMREGTVKPRPQEDEPTFAPPFVKEDGWIDWERGAREIWYFIRAMQPWPVATTRLGQRRLMILSATAHEEETPRQEPGRIERVDRQSFRVSTGKGTLEVLELKPEGKRAMKAGEWLQGYAPEEGERLT